jgi:predicted nuclease of restriction endonuclease-like (RecB) superfamily
MSYLKKIDMSDNTLLESRKYLQLLQNLKEEVKKAQVKAVLSVNTEMLSLYWEIGKQITETLGQSSWGESFLVKLSQDMVQSFPNLKGFSKTNLYNINKWYNFYCSAGINFQQLVGKLPWGHNVLIITKVKNIEEAKWYIEKTIENGWSRNVLTVQIESNLYERQSKERQLSNFEKVLPTTQSDLVKEVIKDRYVLEFIDEYRSEKELELSLINHIEKFLLELGKGFAFVGRQYHLNVAGEDFYLDLLFYHLKLRCFIIIELKTGKFKPEFTGKMNFYLSVLDKEIKQPTDNPSIGIILCKEKNRIIAEYALDRVTSPIGISDYQVKHKLPESLKDSLPTPQELEQEFSSKSDISAK